MTQAEQPPTETRVRSTGRWAFGWSLTSTVLFVGTVKIWTEIACLDSCPEAPDYMEKLIPVGIAGFLVSLLLALIIAIKAILFHVQTKWAVAALCLPFTPLAIAMLYVMMGEF